MKSFASSRARSANPHATCPAAADFLRADGKMAGILPTAARLVAIQKDCVKALPQAFETCSVLKLEEGVLTLSAPNAALAARLKQKLPGLQEKLGQAGWQLDAIKVKVQINFMPAEEAPQRSQKSLPPQALSSLTGLHAQITQSGNQGLAEALATMLDRHKGKK